MDTSAKTLPIEKYHKVTTTSVLGRGGHLAQPLAPALYRLGQLAACGDASSMDVGASR